jgi:2,4-dienoyl-CoA reductase-like NADH-dependent reductase (Old Yellow Enzyme family)
VKNGIANNAAHLLQLSGSHLNVRRQAEMSQIDPLLQPFQLKHLRLKNRIISTSHEPSYAEDAKPKLRYQLYHEEKAKGGIALTMFGGSSNVAVDSPAAFGQIYVGDDDIIPYFQQMAERIQPYGTAVMCQITHMGRRTFWNTEHWLPTIAPSTVREPAHRSFPKAMEISDIKRVVKAYGAAARRCQQGRLDGVEIEAYGHLLDSFWTPLVNRRTDQYGGSLENRMRFSLEVLEEIRKQVGDEFIVGIRMSGDEVAEGGLSHQDCLQIARTLVGTGMLDFVSIIKGYIATDEALSHVIPNMGTPSAPHLNLAAAIKAEIDLPVFHGARIADVATARHAISQGLIDMVGMTRAHLADPHIVAKVERGEDDQIRPCVGAGYCIDRIYGEGEALCVHNPATGREETIAGWWWSGPGRRDWKQLESAPSAVITSSCLKPATNRVGSCNWRRGCQDVWTSLASSIGSTSRLGAWVWILALVTMPPLMTSWPKSLR